MYSQFAPGHSHKSAPLWQAPPQAMHCRTSAPGSGAPAKGADHMDILRHLCDQPLERGAGLHGRTTS
jgi:hypothetical protein